METSTVVDISWHVKHIHISTRAGGRHYRTLCWSPVWKMKMADIWICSNLKSLTLWRSCSESRSESAMIGWENSREVNTRSIDSKQCILHDHQIPKELNQEMLWQCFEHLISYWVLMSRQACENSFSHNYKQSQNWMFHCWFFQLQILSVKQALTQTQHPTKYPLMTGRYLDCGAAFDSEATGHHQCDGQHSKEGSFQRVSVKMWYGCLITTVSPLCSLCRSTHGRCLEMKFGSTARHISRKEISQCLLKCHKKFQSLNSRGRHRNWSCVSKFDISVKYENFNFICCLLYCSK